MPFEISNPFCCRRQRRTVYLCGTFCWTVVQIRVLQQEDRSNSSCGVLSAGFGRVFVLFPSHRCYWLAVHSFVVRVGSPESGGYLSACLTTHPPCSSVRQVFSALLRKRLAGSLTQKRKPLKHYSWSSSTVFSGCLVLVVGARHVQHFPVTLTFLQCGRGLFFVNGRRHRIHPPNTLLVTVYTAPAQSLSAAEPPRKAPRMRRPTQPPVRLEPCL